MFFQALKALVVDGAAFVGGDTLEHADKVNGLAVGHMAGGHRAAADHDRGDIGAEGAHEHARDDLVAVGDADEGVETVGLGHGFDAVGDDLPAGQGILHAGVPHGNAVADADGVELKRDAAGLTDGLLNEVRHLVQVHVAWDDFIEGIADADEGLVEVAGLDEAGGPQEATVWRAFETRFDGIAIHDRSFRFAKDEL